MTAGQDGARAGVWVLGATGRSGRAVTALLAARGLRPVPVGRDATALAALRRSLDGAVPAEVGEAVTAASVAEMAAAIVRARPAVVVNTVGPFTTTAATVADACLRAGADYVDITNELPAVATVLERHDRAVDAGCRLVAGAGFGVSATESVVARLRSTGPAPARVRVDMVPSLAATAGRVGRPLAATMLTGLPDVEGGGRFAGRRIAAGRLAPARLGDGVERLVLPDGGRVVTAAMPLAELIAAQRASGADDVVSASSMAPRGRAVSILAPLLGAVLSVGPVRELATRLLAGVRTRDVPAPRPHSYARARFEYDDGGVVTGWLELGDAGDFTAAVCAEVAARLAAGGHRPGAFTPAALFGPALVEACGAVHLPEETDENRALWLRDRRGRLAVGPAPFPVPGPHQVVVRTRAVAVNPADVITPALRHVVAPWLTYPAVLGSDVAGEVVAVGAEVGRLRVGDRVVGLALGLDRGHDHAAEGAFQRFGLLDEHVVSPVPDGLDLAEACVLPLGVATAATGLFQPDHLGLALPGAGSGTGTVLVWGAATSVGTNAVQLARRAGHDVVAVAGGRNAGYVRGLGARAVLDRHDPAVVADLVALLRDTPFAGALAVGAGSTGACVRVAAALTGNRAVASASPGPAMVGHRLAGRRRGVRVSTIWGSSLAGNAVGPAVYRDLLPAALADGGYRALPPARVVGHGVEHIADGLDALRAGVSATKIVVTL